MYSEETQKFARSILEMEENHNYWFNLAITNISKECISFGIHPLSVDGESLTNILTNSIIEWAQQNKMAAGRDYDVYEVANSPGIWRIRLRKYPSVGEWQGGKVLWGQDRTSKEAAEQIGEHWIETGIWPILEINNGN